jgi:hypothetical protein
MDWKEVIAKLRLVDVSPEIKGEQIGAINVKVENNTYNINLPDGMGLGAMEAIKLTPQFEREVKREAERRLTKLGIPPDLLSEDTRTEIASLTTAASAVDAIKLPVAETVNIRESPVVKLFPESESEK